MSDRKCVSAIVLWSVYSARSSRSASIYVCMYVCMVCKYKYGRWQGRLHYPTVRVGFLTLVVA